MYSITCDQRALVGNIREVLIWPQSAAEMMAQTLISDGRKVISQQFPFSAFYLVADLSTVNLVRFLLNNLFRAF